MNKEVSARDPKPRLLRHKQFIQHFEKTQARKEEVLIQCGLCEKKIKRKHHFHRHLQTHLGEKIHHCSICGYRSIRKDNLKSHLKTHQIFLESSLRKHKSSSGDSDVINAKHSQLSSVLKKERECRLCSFKSTDLKEFQSHVNDQHKVDNFYKCNSCGYKGKNISKMIEHIRTHTGERPFKCNQCNYAAKRKDNLLQHITVRHEKYKNEKQLLSSFMSPRSAFHPVVARQQSQNHRFSPSIQNDAFNVETFTNISPLMHFRPFNYF